MKTKTDNEQKMIQAYDKATNDVHALLSFIGQEIESRDEKKNWATAGSLLHFKESLITVLSDVMNSQNETESKKMILEALEDVA